jgi:cullin-4
MSILEVSTETNLPIEEVRRELAALACKKYRILKKTSEGRKIQEEDSFWVNE